MRMTERIMTNEDDGEKLADVAAEVEGMEPSAEAAAAPEDALDEQAMSSDGMVALEREAAELRSQLDTAKAQARTAALRFREALLRTDPDVPPEMVPESDEIEGIELMFDLAQRIVAQVKEQALEEAQRSARVPAGSPARRAPDLSALSASEKIRMGLESLSEREGR
jgi:hypothetical protein